MSSLIGSFDGTRFSEETTGKYETAAIKVQIDETKQVGLLGPTGFSFVSSAYACEPVPPQVQSLIEIEITSEASVFMGGVEFKMGENLPALFKVLYENEEYTIAEFIEYQNLNAWNFINTNSDILFLLNEQPDISLKQKLTFVFSFDDEFEYQILTDEFIVD